MKRNYFLRGYKKIVGLFLISIISFSTISNVYAKVLTINEVSDKFNTLIVDVYQFFNLVSKEPLFEELLNSSNLFGGNTKVTSSVNTNNNTLDIYIESDDVNEKVFSFTYTNEYIEYDNRNAIVTKEKALEDAKTGTWITYITKAILELSGYKNKDLAEDKDYTNTYDTYGYQLESEPFDYSETNEDGSTESLSGRFIKYFKISLDTDKISTLIEKYGVDAPNLKPTLEVKDITENSVTLYPHVDNENSGLTVLCYIYRSKSKDGTYEVIENGIANCSDEFVVTDNNLESNTTYYYKAKAMMGEYSDILKVTTKGINNKKIGKNPKTGVSFPAITITLMLSMSIAMIIYIKKKSILKKL